MTTYLIEIASATDTFWTLEKCRAENSREAVAELKKSYGEDAIVGYIKVLSE